MRDAQGNIITNLRGRQRVDVSTRYGHRFREYTEPKQMARVTAAAAPLTSSVYDDNAQARTTETLAPSFTTRSRFPPLNRGDSNNATQEEHIMPAGAATTSRKSLHIEPADLDDPEITALLCKNLNLPKPDPLNPKSYKKRMEALLAKAGAMVYLLLLLLLLLLILMLLFFCISLPFIAETLQRGGS